MKVIITDLVSGEERSMPLWAPKIKTDSIHPDSDREHYDMVYQGRKIVIDNIFRSIYKVAFNKHEYPNIFEYDKDIPTPFSSEQTFILSPHADMVREDFFRGIGIRI
jgi:hypothetical protein